MSHSSRYRSDSPGSRRLHDPLRASTGTVPTDLYASPTSYYSHDGLLSAKTAERRGGFFSADTRNHVDVKPISKTAYRDGGHSTKTRTEYAVRPRSQTTADARREPLSLVIPQTSNRHSHVPASAYERTISPLPPRAPYSREDPERYTAPSSRSHRHLYSSDYPSDTGYLEPHDRSGKHRDRGYRVYRPGGVSHYPAYGDPRKWDDSRYYDAYSYTNARETFEKESAARSSQRTSRRNGRPLSMTATEMVPGQSSYARDSRGPPPSQRGFDRLPGGDRLRITSGREYSDSDANRDPRRHPYQRGAVLHQDRDDGYYSVADDPKDTRNHRHRSRHRGSLKHAEELLAPVLSGLATLGLASGYSDDGRSDKHRSRDSEYGRDRNKDYDRDHRDREREKIPSDDRRLRSQRQDDSSASDSEARTRRRDKSSARRHHSSSDSDSEQGPRQRNRVSSSRHRSKPKDETSEISSKRGAAENGSEDRPRKPVAVEPPIAKEPETPPKSILKAPREKFPEDENPIREGVAPLKDAQKKGIPPGARWTKIDRRLVNPAALNLGHERFEERSDYVIVLRVLTKEEIQAYAVKTQEIRGESALLLLFFGIFFSLTGL